MADRTPRPSHDLIELHIVGGPWTPEEASQIGDAAAALLMSQLRREIVRQTGIKPPINIANVYCSDTRGEDG